MEKEKEISVKFKYVECKPDPFWEVEVKNMDGKSIFGAHTTMLGAFLEYLSHEKKIDTPIFRLQADDVDKLAEILKSHIEAVDIVGCFIYEDFYEKRGD